MAFLTEAQVPALEGKPTTALWGTILGESLSMTVAVVCYPQALRGALRCWLRRVHTWLNFLSQ